MGDVMPALVHIEQLPRITDLLVEELVEVQAAHFGFFADAQVHAGDVFEDQEEDATDDEGVGADGGDFCELFADWGEGDVSIGYAWIGLGTYLERRYR